MLCARGERAEAKRNVHLLATENQALLHRRNTLLLFDAFLDLGNFVVGLDVEFDLFACEGADSGSTVSIHCLLNLFSLRKTQRLGDSSRGWWDGGVAYLISILERCRSNYFCDGGWEYEVV